MVDYDSIYRFYFMLYVMPFHEHGMVKHKQLLPKHEHGLSKHE